MTCGVTDIFGFRDGFRGLVGGAPPVRLSHDMVADIHNKGGTILGTSRGNQDPDEMVTTLARLGACVLFVIGGDGSLRGAQQIADAAQARGIRVVARWHGRFVHVPIALATGSRNQVDPDGDLWLSVLEATGQPERFC